MSVFDVHVFLASCFIPSPLRLSERIAVQPFEGIGGNDVVDLIDKYLEQVLNQPPHPADQRQTMLGSIKKDEASVVVSISGVDAADYEEAIGSTEESLMLCRDVLALRQLHRGYIAGFLAVQTDVSPTRLYSKVRRPYAGLRKVTNLPFGETESDIVDRIVQKAKIHPLLRVYLSLYADTLPYSDSLITETGLEGRLLKTWSFLETMAASESPRGKKAKVKALFMRYELSRQPNYLEQNERDLLDIAYQWRNIVAHSGGCASATEASDIEFCRTFHRHLSQILEDLNQSGNFLLHAFADSLPPSSHQ